MSAKKKAMTWKGWTLAGGVVLLVVGGVVYVVRKYGGQLTSKVDAMLHPGQR